MSFKDNAKLLSRVASKICDMNVSFEVEIGSRSVNYFPSSGMLTQVELMRLSQLAISFDLRYYVSVHNDRVCFVIYIPSLVKVFYNE